VSILSFDLIVKTSLLTNRAITKWLKIVSCLLSETRNFLRLAQTSLDSGTPPLMASNPLSHLQYIIHHVFLPPELPQEYDGSAAQDLHLTTLFRDALQSFCDLQPLDAQSYWQGMITGLDLLATGENASSTSIKEVIESLPKMKSGGK
jgi:hypothetical protein